MANKRLFICGLMLAAVVLALDQGSKWLLLSIMLPDNHPIEIVPFFGLALVWNSGISFGMFAAHERPYPLIVLALVIIAILLRWMYKNNSPWTICALGCVIGGALGNIVDRLRYGAVIDFFDAHIGPYHWPAFNVADSAIFIGVVLLCLNGMFTERQNIKGNTV